MKKFPGLFEIAIASQRSDGKRSAMTFLIEERFLNRTDASPISIAHRMHLEHNFKISMEKSSDW